jgi:hypothetical protein
MPGNRSPPDASCGEGSFLTPGPPARSEPDLAVLTQRLAGHSSAARCGRGNLVWSPPMSTHVADMDRW